MNTAKLIEAANELLSLLEAKQTGLRHRKHARHILPARATIEQVMRSYWKRQEAALLKEVKPHLRKMLQAFPPKLKESTDPHANQFAANVLPSSLRPLRFPVTKGESDDYADAIEGAILGAAKTLTKDLATGAISSKDFAATYLRNNSLTKLTGEISTETTKRLRDSIADAWEQGGSFDQIVDALHSTFEDFSESRARMIAQTEANDAYNEARRSLAAELGMDEKRWEPDGEACETCEENAAADWIGIEEDFPSGDSEPTAHPNCDCGLDFRKSGSVANEEEE